MKIINVDTNQEIVNPDLSIGELSTQSMWASPEAYATIDNVTKFALDESDYEIVQFYHAWTDEELERIEKSKNEQEHREIMESLPDAIAELSSMVSDNSVSMEVINDAIAELSTIVSGLMEGA